MSGRDTPDRPLSADGAKPPTSAQNPQPARSGSRTLVRSLPLWAVIATAVGAVAPTAALAIGVGGVASAAGNATWLTYLLITIGVGGVAYCVSYLARSIATSGGLYGFGAAVAGSPGGYAAGVASLVVLALALPLEVIGSSIYLLAALSHAGLGDGRAVHLVAYLVVLGIAVALSLTEVRVSTRLLLYLELVSLTFVIVLFVISLFHKGAAPVVDTGQLELHGATIHGVLVAFAFATFAIAGFENAATLGAESTNPRRDIPRALVGTVIVLGVLLTVGSYVQIRSLGIAGLLASDAPLNSLANQTGTSWFGVVIDLCVGFSYLSCVLALLNSAARILLNFGEKGALPSALARTSARRRQPFVAIVCLAVVTVVISLGFGVSSVRPIDALNYLGSIIGYILFIVYFTAVALAVIHAFRSRGHSTGLYVSALLGGGTMVIALIFTFTPWPSGVYLRLFWVFVALVAVAAVVFAVGWIRKPRWWAAIGTGTEKSFH
jgi:amino acid transporter